MSHRVRFSPAEQNRQRTGCTPKPCGDSRRVRSSRQRLGVRPVLWRFCVGCSSAPHVFKQAFRLLSFFSVAARLTAAGFFSNPEHVASLTPALWETAEIGALWSDDFTRSALGTNWLILGGANVSITNNEVLFVEANIVYSRQLLHQPQQLCSDSWTIRWTQRFAA